MRGFLSMVVLVASFALLVPDNNGAQAVNAAGIVRPIALGAGHGISGVPAVAEQAPERAPAELPDASWLLALGFLGVVMARRLRAE